MNILFWLPLDSQDTASIKERLPTLGLLVLLVLFFALRLPGISDRPLTIDEATIASFVPSVIESGYPYVYVSTMEVPLATYEAVPYFLALSTLLTGEFSEFSLRLPALLFSAATLILVYLVCLRQFGLFAALLSGALLSLSSWAIYWSQNCFHPAQAQFFALVTALIVQQLIKQDQVKLSTSLWLWLAFSMLYLSWEGAGFILPVSALIVLWYKRTQLSWLFQKNLWVMYLLVVLTVVAQGVRRTALQEPHLMLGTGKGDMSLPQLGFLSESWEPYFYLINFFGMESHLLIGIIFIVGAFYIKRAPEVQYFYLYFFAMIFCLSNFLLFYNAHYLYFVYTFFIISSGVILTEMIRHIQQLANQEQSEVIRVLGLLVSVLLLSTTAASVNTQSMKLYDLNTASLMGMRQDYRHELVGPDYRKVSQDLEVRWSENDKVISMAPMPTLIYSDIRPDYFLQTITDRKVVYDKNLDTPFYRDKFLGTQVLRSITELKQIMAEGKRVWLVAAPLGSMPMVIDAETLAYVNEHMRVVTESFDARLYLWEP